MCRFFVEKSTRLCQNLPLTAGEENATLWEETDIGNKAPSSPICTAVQKGTATRAQLAVILKAFYQM